MWLLIPTIVLLPLILNLLQWRRDFERIHKLAASRKNISPQDLAGATRVSFLVAAWNEEPTVQYCIEAILRLNYPNLELVLSAGGADDTWRIASQFRDPQLILLEQRTGDGKQKSLQQCLEKATGEIIYLVDADCLITDSAFAQILSPILNRNEQAVTGSPCTPFPEQREIPFVVSQCASRVYTSICQSEYCSGLLGANSAIRREALEQAGGFDAGIRTGGDYDLGKRLLRQGTRIRYEVEATFPIKFHSEVRPYLRQQSRWLRNAVIHGLRFRAYREVASCLFTSLLGLVMLVLPCLVALAMFLGVSSVIVRISAAVWAAGIWNVFLSRLRYLKVAAFWLGIRVSWRVLTGLPLFLLIDFVAWSIPLVQYSWKNWRERW